MPTMKLTQLAVDRIGKPVAGRIEYFDTVLPSFGMRISSTGARSWVLFYRVHGVQRRFTIGTLAQLPKVDDARQRARELLQDVERGIDPAEVKATAKAATPALPPAERDTVRNVAKQFIERYAKPRNKSWKEADASLQRHVVSRWGDREMASITRRDILDLLDGLTDQGFTIAPRRVLAAVHKLMVWSIERDIIPANPASGIKAPGKEIERERVLTDDELRRLWIAADGMGPTAGGFIKTLILTGQRRDEVATMKWADVDFEHSIYEERGGVQVKVGTAAVWTLPREKTKGDRQHEVPLSALAVEVLQSMPRIGEYVFTTRGDRPISGYSKFKQRADSLSGIEADWRFHDLRRTAGTGMASLGIPPGTISRVLNHKEGGVTKIYNRYGYLPEKRRALDTWARKVESLIRPAAANVVELRGAVG